MIPVLLLSSGFHKINGDNVDCVTSVVASMILFIESFEHSFAILSPIERKEQAMYHALIRSLVFQSPPGTSVTGIAFCSVCSQAKQPSSNILT